jgi:FKBP-type peptidyl-prolyl cis-trans isomerase FklB
MRKVPVLLLAAVALHVGTSWAKTPSTEPEKLGYTVGHQLGQTLKGDIDRLDVEQLLAGLRDVLTGAAPQLSQDEMTAVAQAYRQEAVAERQRLAQKNLEASRAFLAENGKQAGVVKLPSGLQYQVLKKGSGGTPTLEDRVRVHYRGTLKDGEEFDSSYQRGTPAVLPVSRTVAGWREALPMMKVGDRWKLYVPPALGYGEAGAPGRIGPNEVLIFEIELLGIEPKA